MASALTQTYDYEQEDSELKRKQAIIDALQQSSLAPLQLAQNNGAQASKTHWSNMLAKGIQAYAAVKGQEKLKAERGELGQRYRDDLRTGMEAFDKTSRGGDFPAGNYGPMPDGSPMEESTITKKGDPRKAVFDALASNHPVMRDFAMKQLAEQAKGAITPKDLLTHANPASVFAAPNDPTKWTGKPNLQSMTPGAPILDVNSGQFVNPQAAMPGAAPTTRTIGGDLYQQSPTGLKKLDNAPKISTTVNNSVINKGETKFMEGVGTANAKSFEEAKAAKVTAQRTIQSMQKLEQLEAAGVFSGPQSSPAMFVGSVLEGMGVPVDKKRLGNSQAYQGELLANLGAQLTGSLARSTTDKDMEILKAPLPQLIGSAEGRAALRRQAIAKAQEHVQYADAVQQKLVTAYPEAARLLDTSPGQVPVPQRSDTVAPGNARTVKWGDLD